MVAEAGQEDEDDDGDPADGGSGVVRAVVRAADMEEEGLRERGWRQDRAFRSRKDAAVPENATLRLGARRNGCVRPGVKTSRARPDVSRGVQRRPAGARPSRGPGRTRGVRPVRRGYSDATAASSASMASGRTRLTVQPPNPAPVIRAATTPGHGRGDLDHRVELRGADLEPVAQRGVALGEQAPDGGQVAGREGGHGRLDPGVLGDDVLGAPVGDRIEAVAGRGEQPRASRRAGCGSPGRSRPARRRPPRTGCAAGCTRSRRGGAASRCGRRRARCRAAAGSPASRATGNRAGPPRRRRRTTRRTGPSARSGRRRSRSPRAGRAGRAGTGRRPGRRRRGAPRPTASSIAADDERPALGGRVEAMTPRRPVSGRPASVERPGRARDVVEPRAGLRARLVEIEAVALAVIEPDELDPPIVGRQVGDPDLEVDGGRAGRSPRCSRCARR